MTLFSLAFLCGIIILLQFFTTLPSLIWVIILFSICLLLFLFRKYYFIPVIGVFLGFVWVIVYLHFTNTWGLPQELEGKTLQIKGKIVSIPETNINGTKFLFKMKEKGLIRLSWKLPDATILKMGDEWQLPVRLKRIHGLMNPGGFDYEAWCFLEGIRAEGYVTQGNPIKIHTARFSYYRIRQYFYDKLRKNLPQSNTAPWIIALAIGERHGIPAEYWKVLRNTGTNHLMAIAGLHIGFMSGFIYSIISWCWRRIPKLALKIPTQLIGGFAALCMAILYSALAGFSIPTERASCMFAVLMVFVLLRRKIAAWHAFSLALFCVLLLNPLTVLSTSFWLSFGSVALIIYAMRGRLFPKGLWWKYARIQWVIAIGLIPLSIGLFQECSLISFVANSIAIPVVGFLILPLTMLGTFLLIISAKTGGFFLMLADKILQILWEILTYLSHLSWGNWYHATPNQVITVFAMVGVMILLFPKGLGGRLFGIFWILPLFLYKPETPNRGEVWFTLLDVGQGLSAVVQTKHHLLVFDTGAKLNENYDMGESVVLPFLRTKGIKKIDMLVISHGDNDHIGGADAIYDGIKVLMTKTSVPQKILGKNIDYCLSGNTWIWDNVEFTFLYPDRDQLGLGNDSSCVLRVTNQYHQRILLTGDIEKNAENYLIKNMPLELFSDILIAPHHGSKTSAVKAFIDLVHPKIVLFPIGYRNRYHFPHAKVLEQYAMKKTEMYDTAKAGSIQFHLDKNLSLVPELYREKHRQIYRFH